MKNDYLFAETEADAAALFFGAEKWNENFIHHFFGYALAIVGDL